NDAPKTLKASEIAQKFNSSKEQGMPTSQKTATSRRQYPRRPVSAHATSEPIRIHEMARGQEHSLPDSKVIPFESRPELQNQESFVRSNREQANVITVLVADDHPVVREGLIALIDRQPDMRVVAQASNGLEAV